MSDTIKIRVNVRTGILGSDQEIILEFDREEWEDMGWKERQDALLDIVLGMISWNYEEVD